MSDFQRQECFVDRAVLRGGIVEHNDWRLKQYDISFDGAAFPEIDFRAGVSLALRELQHPAVTRNRPGVGFLIRHAGKEAHYVVLGWWDNQNELLTRIMVRELSSRAPWHDASGGFSFCVWDLKVMWHERNAFVKHVLSPPFAPDIQGYLRDAL